MIGRRAARRRWASAWLVAAGLMLANVAVPVPTSGQSPPPVPGFLGKPDATQGAAAALASMVPSGFQETVVWSGLSQPTAIRFASDGRIFVAEKSGLVKEFDSPADGTPTIFADLRANVDDYWDRGLLGLALAPTFPADPSVYVLYTYDHILGDASPAPRWNDGCPTPPGAVTDGCVASARLSRLTASGNVAVGPEVVLVEDWCQQFPSHTVGTLAFGPDGRLYAGAGDAGTWTTIDYGQFGGTLPDAVNPVTPRNPCGDPPAGVGGAETAPSAEGGALRAQDMRTSTPNGSASYSTTVLGMSPEGYWRLGESGGTTAVDATGRHPGTYLGNPAKGIAGALVADADTAVSFDNTDDTVSVPAGAGLDAGSGPFTIAGWYRTTDAGWGILASQRNDTGPSPGWLLGLSDGGGMQFKVSDGVQDPYLAVADPPGARDGNWHFLVATRNGSTAAMYFDGAFYNSTSTFGTVSASSSQALRIGRTDETGNVFNGGLDDVAFFRTALTGAQVQSLWQAGRSGGGASDPVTLDGSIIRIDPATGAGAPGNPFASSTDPNARRIMAYGLRNPFRFTFRPGTNELWLGDVGFNDWEEIDRVADVTDGTERNFGWPCYEGAGRQASFDAADLTICENLYAQAGAATTPYYTYNHQSTVVSGETCPVGSSSVTGVAFAVDTSFPARYNNALFFADHSRNCIWAMLANTSGLPDPSQIETFEVGAANPVDLQFGPGGDLWYVDFDGGAVRRITAIAGNQLPIAVATGQPLTGPAPLAVAFDGTGSSDPDVGDTITYSWDLNGDGQYGDAATPTATYTYTAAGTYLAGLRVTDNHGAASTTTLTVTVSGAANAPPVPVIDSPSTSLTWAVGDPIAFSGHATDAEDGNLAAARMTWTLIIHHCPSNCHTHTVQSFIGVATGSVSAPDHDYPSYLELQLTATDSAGATGTTSVLLYPQTVNLTLMSNPSGLQLSLGAFTSTAPFTRTVIVKSATTLTAASPQTAGGLSYAFESWSDGGGQTHTVIAPTAPTTYTATFSQVFADISVTKTAARSGKSKKITYTITIGNPGPISAAGVGMTDTLPPLLTYGSATSTLGSCSYSATTRVVTCQAGTLASGQNAVVTLIVTTAVRGTYTNTAHVTTTTPEQNLSNNTSTVSIKVR